MLEGVYKYMIIVKRINAGKFLGIRFLFLQMKKVVIIAQNKSTASDQVALWFFWKLIPKP